MQAKRRFHNLHTWACQKTAFILYIDRFGFLQFFVIKLKKFEKFSMST